MKSAFQCKEKNPQWKYRNVLKETSHKLSISSRAFQSDGTGDLRWLPAYNNKCVELTWWQIRLVSCYEKFTNRAFVTEKKIGIVHFLFLYITY